MTASSARELCASDRRSRAVSKASSGVILGFTAQVWLNHSAKAGFPKLRVIPSLEYEYPGCTLGQPELCGTGGVGGTERPFDPVNYRITVAPALPSAEGALRASVS